MSYRRKTLNDRLYGVWRAVADVTVSISYLTGVDSTLRRARQRLRRAHRR